MKVSIITPVLNGRETIRDTLKSIGSQGHKNIEHIIVDGGSRDGTLEIIRGCLDGSGKVLSEPDKNMYEAINKGIAVSSGEIVGILNSDDFYADTRVIETVVRRMKETGAGLCWGNLVYVSRSDEERVVRYWESAEYSPGKFRRGWMPPHPAFFVRRNVYDEFGAYNTEFNIAADYELMLRFLEKNRVSSCYIPKVFVKMRCGGKSNRSLLQIFKANIECCRAWQVNGYRVNYYTLLLKPLSKILQYFISL